VEEPEKKDKLMSDGQLRINLVDILDLADQDHFQKVYSDGYFARRTGKMGISNGAEVNVIVDCISELKIGVAYLSINLPPSNSLEIVADSPNCRQYDNGTVIKFENKDAAIWLPEKIFATDTSGNNRICHQLQADSSRCDDHGFCLTLSSKENRTINFTVVFANNNADEFISQVCSPQTFEEQKLKRHVLFEYTRIDDVWNYLFMGDVYCTNVHDPESYFKYPSQQVAKILYAHMHYLHAMSGKTIYRFLYDLIAYSVMLSLSDDGRWRHGAFVPEVMETHTRFQVSGICLLASYYEKTNRDIFLTKAQTAMDYILTLADDMTENSLWYIHDTLEQKDYWDKHIYKNDLKSTAFGKSQYNSLCLNTHIWTLLGLHKLKEVSADDRYDDYINKGMTSLKIVMQAKPAQPIYRLVYRLHDILGDRVFNGAGRIIRELNRRYAKMLRGKILPFMKTKFPRVNMPTGFIERDLTHSCFSEIYHLGTLEDLLLLYDIEPSKWLKETITGSIEYTHKSGFVKRFAKHHSAANIFIDILLLYSTLIDDSYLELLPQYIAFFREHDIVPTSDVVSNDMICSDRIGVSVDNESLNALTIGTGDNFLTVIVNPDGQTKKTNIDLHFLADLSEEDISISGSNGTRIPSVSNIEIPSNDFIKITGRID